MNLRIAASRPEDTSSLGGGPEGGGSNVVVVDVNWQILGDLRRDIARVGDVQIPMDGLTPEVQRIAYDENRKRALAGDDRFGIMMKPIAPATVKWRRRVGKGGGPPLAPDGEGSRSVRTFLVAPVTVMPNRLVLMLAWPQMPWLHAHTVGQGRLPVRDIEGLTPDADLFIGEVFDEYVRLRVDEALDDIFLAGGPSASFSSVFGGGGRMRGFEFGIASRH
jgi:hypothetical protein